MKDGAAMELTYAIGDVHGCRGLLVQLLETVDSDARGRNYALVFLGDYIDKGPDSAGVLDLLMRLQAGAARAVVCLRGNHDQALVEAASGEPAAQKWLTMGGDAVLAQYGVGRAADLPLSLLAWMNALPTFHEEERRYFVHAGVDPAKPLSAQADEMRLSMRGAFLAEDHDFGKHIVHGHTPQLSGLPELRPYRTNLDTGVVSTGRLTAAAFEAERAGPSRILQARSHGGPIVEKTDFGSAATPAPPPETALRHTADPKRLP